MSKCLQQCDKSTPLQFVYFAPHWIKSPETHKKLKGFISAELIVENRKHVYKQGNDYRKIQRMKKATNDTQILILQNKSARATWPLTENMLEEIKEAMEDSEEK